MKAKTIKAVLGSIHREFVNSIEDENVRNLVNKDAIITGGAIASMLLGEKVNDYDYYFRTRETALAVANYYVGLFNNLNPDFNASEPPSVKEKDGRVIIYIQSKGVAYDSDLMGEVRYFDHGFRTDELEIDLETVVNAIQESQEIKYKPVFLSRNAITLDNKIQLVLRFYGEPEEIHDNYDFVHCTNYYLPFEHKLVLNPNALESLLTKELKYMGSKYPICSVIRTRKFVKRGWGINAGQYLKMCFQISELDLTNFDVLEEQLIGVDTYYFQQIIQILREKQEKDPGFKLDANHLAVIIDKIF